jgi:hypothetical protein
MRLVIALAALAAGLALAACGTVNETGGSAPSGTVTRTVGPSGPSASSASSTPPGTGPQSGQDVTDPWAVVSAYYGDIESGSYAQAWALLSSGAVTGQTYQQFVDGFACTGAQQLTDQGESGNQVSFSLAATDSCTGAVQHFSGTDTVSGGRIVAAHIIQTG